MWVGLSTVGVLSLARVLTGYGLYTLKRVGLFSVLLYVRDIVY
jgi:hypothetical protein